MKTSAPGKLMLFGEHAAVYGYPCLVTAISQRLTVTAGEPHCNTRFIDAAVAAWGKPNTRLCGTSSFSGKYGFGSSAAVTVAALKYLRPEATKQEIFDTAYKIVLKIQGTGSGFDVAAAVYGGTLYYIKNKVIEPIIVKNMPLIVGYTGVKSNTVDLVQQVAQKRKAHERIFQAIAKLVEEAKQKILDGPARNASASVAGGDWERVGKLMDFDQEYLRDLGVSSEKLETLISAAKSAGAYGAKLSGAGGGDCMIALGPPAVKEAIRKAGGEVIDVTSNAEGVRIEP